MSMSALLQAVRDTLRTSLVTAMPGGVGTYAKNYVDIRCNGAPIGIAGEWFVAIDEGAIRSTERACLKEEYGVIVTITHRQTVYPRDRSQGVYLDTSHGLDVLERLCITAIHGSHTVRSAANTAGGFPDNATGDSFIIPLYYTGRGPTRPEDGSWAGMEPEAATFLVRSLNFQGALRTQAFDIMH